MNFKLAKLAATFGKAVMKHRKKIMNAADVDFMTRDLGEALNEQKNILTNPRNSTIERVIEYLPQMAEVRVLTAGVSKHLGIDTNDKDHNDILKEIVDKMEARDCYEAVHDIRANLEWINEFYSMPEAEELMQMKVADVEKPDSMFDFKGMGKMVGQTAKNKAEDVKMFYKFVQKVKQYDEKQRNKAAKIAAKDRKKQDPKGGTNGSGMPSA